MAHEKVHVICENLCLEEGMTKGQIESGFATKVEKNNLQGQIDVEKSRIDNITNLPSGSTTGDAELIDIRVSSDGNTYSTAGNSVRQQIINTNNKIKNNLKAYNNLINTHELNLSTDLFEIGGVNNDTGNNIAATDRIRTKGYLKFDELTRILKISSSIDAIANIVKYPISGSYQRTSTSVYLMNTFNKNLFLPISKNCKYRIVLIKNETITSINEFLSKFTFNVTDYYENKENEVFDIKELNLINPNFTFNNVSISWQNGLPIIDTETNYTTVFSIVEGNKQYYMSDVGFYTSFFDEDMNLITPIHLYPSTQLTNPFTTPSNAKYMLTVKSKSSIGTRDYISEYNKRYDYNEILVNFKNDVINKDDLKPISKLKGKTINIFGDSISSTDYTLPYWGEIIANKTNCTVNNYGISGTTLAHTHDRHLWDYHFGRLDAAAIGYVQNDPTTWHTGNCFCERFSKVDDNSDAIVIMGGTNDNGVTLGEWNSSDTSTFYGALNTLFSGILNRMVGKKILVCTPIQHSTAYTSNVKDALSVLDSKNSTDTLTIQLRAEAIKEKCKQYGIPCLDLFNTSGINGTDTNKVYFRTNDGLHPSSIGQELLAALIQTELEKMF